MTQLQTSLFLVFVFCSNTTFSQHKADKEYWFSFVDTTKNKCGYLNKNADTVIQADYEFCFTDTFKVYAIVLNKNSQFVAIDRQQHILYNIFPFDNGPDYASDGFFRIVKNNKIGYADEKNGKVIIEPQFECAFPFEYGIAKVGLNCVTHSDDAEHHYRTSGNWIYINKKGKRVNSLSPKK